MSIRNLEFLLAPKSVALVGASGRPGSLGAVVLDRLTAAPFRGPLHLVNPKHRSLGDRPCVASARELAEVDLGVVVTPPRAVANVIADLAAVGARGAVVITAGLDAGDRRRMLQAAQPHCLRILGPNCLGLQAPWIDLDASFAHMTARRGNLALLSQSGAIVTAMLDWAEARGLGFSLVASVGDMADVDVGDLLDHLAADAETRAILLYLEQVTQSRKFMSAARSASRSKPVIAIKAGRTAAAARAAASHTGALAGADDVYEAALRRAGILRVDDLEQLFDAADALARHRPLASGRLAILTNGGGAGVMAVDALATTTGQLAELRPETLMRLDAALPPNWSRGNPVDIIGDAGPARYDAALTALLEDPAADAVLVINCPTGLASSSEAAAAVAATVARRKAAGEPLKPILASWLGEATAAPAARLIELAGIPTYPTPTKAVRAFDQLVRHGKAQSELMRTPPSLPQEITPDRATARRLLTAALDAGRAMLSEPEAKAVLAAYGIPTVPTEVAATPEAAAEIAERMLRGASADALPPTLVVKILSPDISHKSDVGGVRLDLASAAAVREAAAAMIDRARQAQPAARIDGVVVQPMIRRTRAHELIVGLSDDRTFGPVVLFGAGGTSVEVVADRALALPPLDLALAEQMIGRTRIARLLRGYRDRPAADTRAVAETLVRLASLSADMPEVLEVDINPLLADQNGVIALDARIAVVRADPVAPGGNPRFSIRPYPSAWDRPADARGGAVRIRPIRPEDEALFADFLRFLTPEDMRLRFFASVGHMGHAQIARLTQIDYARAMAFVALDPADGSLIGEVRLAADPDNVRAEFAVAVRSDRQGRGIGRALMTRLIDYARTESIGEIFGDVLDRNAAMRRLCRDLGFVETEHPEDRSLQRVSLRCPER